LLEGLVDQVRQRQFERLFQDNADDSQSLSAQGKRIGRSRRQQTHAKAARDRIHFVRNAQQGAFDPFRDGPAGPNRQVVFVDGLRHRLRFRLQTSIGTPHNPLKLRKFADHAGNQVRLAQIGSSEERIEMVGSHPLPKPARQRRKPLHLLPARPQFGMKDHRLQLSRPILQTHLLILFIVKTGIFETSTNHPGIARRHQLEIPGRGIGHRHKIAKQVAFSVGNGKITLVLLDHGDEKLRRQFEILLFEFPHQRLRVFNQLGDFIQKLFIL